MINYAILDLDEKGLIKSVSYPYSFKPQIEETGVKKVIQIEIDDKLLYEINENLEEGFHKLENNTIVRVKEIRPLVKYMEEQFKIAEGGN